MSRTGVGGDGLRPPRPGSVRGWAHATIGGPATAASGPGVPRRVVGPADRPAAKRERNVLRTSFVPSGPFSTARHYGRTVSVKHEPRGPRNGPQRIAEARSGGPAGRAPGLSPVRAATVSMSEVTPAPHATQPCRVARRLLRATRGVLSLPLAVLAALLSPAVASASTSASTTIWGAAAAPSTCSRLAAVTTSTTGRSVAGGDRVPITLGNPTHQGYRSELYAPGTTASTFAAAPARDRVE